MAGLLFMLGKQGGQPALRVGGKDAGLVDHASGQRRKAGRRAGRHNDGD